MLLTRFQTLATPCRLDHLSFKEALEDLNLNHSQHRPQGHNLLTDAHQFFILGGSFQVSPLGVGVEGDSASLIGTQRT